MAKQDSYMRITTRIPPDLEQWLKSKESMNAIIIEALREMKYREENQDPYATGWRDGFEVGKKDGDE